jgi:hypothetical protein
MLKMHRNVFKQIDIIIKLQLIIYYWKSIWEKVTYQKLIFLGNILIRMQSSQIKEDKEKIL